MPGVRAKVRPGFQTELHLKSDDVWLGVRRSGKRQGLDQNLNQKIRKHLDLPKKPYNTIGASPENLHENPSIPSDKTRVTTAARPPQAARQKR